MIRENGIIRKTHLGPEDHGILTCWLTIEGDHWGQAFGGYNLAFGDEMKRWVAGVLAALDKDRWEDLPGTPVRVERENPHTGRILRIGHIVEDRWFTAAGEAK